MAILQKKLQQNCAPCKPPQKRTPKQQHAPKTSAKAAESGHRSNLTLSDWLTVYQFINNHPSLPQREVIKHFATCPTGALIFNQSTLSRKLRDRPKMEARINETPNALSSKRPHTVTRPDVEEALVLWTQNMEARGEAYSGAMLIAKRASFEDQLGVPDDERVKGGYWVQSFCRAYKIKQIRLHGESGSVDIDAVAKERLRLQQILANYAPEDIYNFDETGLFA